MDEDYIKALKSWIKWLQDNNLISIIDSCSIKKVSEDEWYIQIGNTNDN